MFTRLGPTPLLRLGLLGGDPLEDVAPCPRSHIDAPLSVFSSPLGLSSSSLQFLPRSGADSRKARSSSCLSLRSALQQACVIAGHHQLQQSRAPSSTSSFRPSPSYSSAQTPSSTPWPPNPSSSFSFEPLARRYSSQELDVVSSSSSEQGCTTFLLSLLLLHVA